MADETVIETPAAPAAETETTDATVETTEDPKTFSAEYVAELRKENASYRTRAKELEAVFEGLEPDQIDGWKEVVTTWKEDPKAGASVLKEIADSWLEAQADAGITPDDADYVSRAEIKRMLEEEKAAQAEQSNLERIEREIETQAKTLGYTPNSKDLKENLTARLLFNIAADLPDNSLEEADKMLKKLFRDDVIEDYLKSKADDAGNTPTAPVAGGAAPSHAKDAKTPTSLADVEEAAVARVRAMKHNV